MSNFAPCSDIYSLGATFYFLLTGKTPPEASDVNDDGLPLLPATVSVATAKAIECAMQPKRKERPQSVGDFLALLDGKVEVDDENTIILSVVPPKRIIQPQSKRVANWKKWLSGIAVFLILIIAGVFISRMGGGSADVEMVAAGKDSLAVTKDSIPVVVQTTPVNALAGSQQNEEQLASQRLLEQKRKEEEIERKRQEELERKRQEEASIFLSNYSQLQIGDYYYSDGTFSHKRVDSKNCVGIVFSLRTTAEEKHHGWTHGQIMALKDVSGRFRWNVEKKDLPAPHINYDEENAYSAFQDRNGCVYSHSGYTDGDNFPAFDAARNYSAPLPLKRTSGWYLPSIGQWVDVIQNLGQVTFRENRYFDQSVALLNMASLNIGEDYYWSSTGKKSFVLWSVTFSHGIVRTYSYLESFRVRPVAAI